MDMPETIWADTYSGKTDAGYWHKENPVMIGVKYRRADLPPRVKPLVWVQCGSSYRAPAPLFGNIRVDDYSMGAWIVLWSAPGICDMFTPGAYDTPEAAKSAAQADYNARILAALEGES